MIKIYLSNELTASGDIKFPEFTVSPMGKRVLTEDIDLIDYLDPRDVNEVLNVFLHDKSPSADWLKCQVSAIHLAWMKQMPLGILFPEAMLHSKWQGIVARAIYKMAKQGMEFVILTNSGVPLNEYCHIALRGGDVDFIEIHTVKGNDDTCHNISEEGYLTDWPADFFDSYDD